jgi:heme oxygenase
MEPTELEEVEEDIQKVEEDLDEARADLEEATRLGNSTDLFLERLNRIDYRLKFLYEEKWRLETQPISKSCRYFPPIFSGHY